MFSKKEDYIIFKIPKRRGGYRVIEKPNDELKKKQRESVKKLREYFKESPFAHGFVPYRNIATMAKGHVNKKYVASIDIEDFFPSITWEKFKSKVEIPNKEIENELKIHFCDFEDGKGLRLPQGAPGSPFLSNIYMLKFDWSLAWIAYNFDFDYSRYADDITISGNWLKGIKRVLEIIRKKLKEDYQLNVNEKKTKIMPYYQRQMVCGVIVNEKLNLPRRWRKRLRAEIFQQRINGKELSKETLGKISFEKMIRECLKDTKSSREYLKEYLENKSLAEVI